MEGVAKALEKGFKVSVLCKAVKCSRSSYYSHQTRKWNRANRDAQALSLVQAIHGAHSGRIGIRRIQLLLDKKGVRMNIKKIARLKREYGLITTIRRRNGYLKIRSKSQEHREVEHLLKRQFNQSAPTKVYATDITCLRYGRGSFAYLSATKDVASREIVSYRLSRNNWFLISEEMEGLLSKLSSEERSGLLIHSDQGMHYTHINYRSVLSRYGVRQSMSRKGNCLDNAPIESFFGHLKDELRSEEYKSYEALEKGIADYMNSYNTERAQWGLKKMTPVAYRNHLLRLAAG